MGIMGPHWHFNCCVLCQTLSLASRGSWIVQPPKKPLWAPPTQFLMTLSQLVRPSISRLDHPHWSWQGTPKEGKKDNRGHLVRWREIWQLEISPPNWRLFLQTGSWRNLSWSAVFLMFSSLFFCPFWGGLRKWNQLAWKLQDMRGRCSPCAVAQAGNNVNALQSHRTTPSHPSPPSRNFLGEPPCPCWPAATGGECPQLLPSLPDIWALDCGHFLCSSWDNKTEIRQFWPHLTLRKQREALHHSQNVLVATKRTTTSVTG